MTSNMHAVNVFSSSDLESVVATTSASAMVTSCRVANGSSRVQKPIVVGRDNFRLWNIGQCGQLVDAVAFDAVRWSGHTVVGAAIFNPPARAAGV